MAYRKGKSGLITGYQKLGDAGTAIQLTTDGSSELIKAITILAHPANSSQIIFGDSGIVASSNTKGFDASEGITFEPLNTPPMKLTDFYINGGASSDGVDFYAINA